MGHRLDLVEDWKGNNWFLGRLALRYCKKTICMARQVVGLRLSRGLPVLGVWLVLSPFYLVYHCFYFGLLIQLCN